MTPNEGAAAVARARKGKLQESGESGRAKVTFSLPREVVDTLRDLADQRGITMTEVLRQAVTTEKFLADAQQQGDEILLYNEGKKRTRQLLLR